jgi:hypothetical protein
VLVVVAGAIICISSVKEKPCSNCQKNIQTGKSEEVTFTDYFKNETDLCTILTKEIVSNLLGKTVLKTNAITTNTLHSCQYYLSDSQAVIVNYDTLNVAKQKQGHEVLDRKVATNPKILMDHFLAIQENGLINEIYLVLGENEYVSINRTSGKTISEDEIVGFAAKLSEIVSGIVPLPAPRLEEVSKDQPVPVSQEEDIVRNFFVLIDEKKPSDAVSMMADSITKDDSLKQAWAVQFNAIKSLKVTKIEPSLEAEWSSERHKYKLTLNVLMNSDSANAPIPYYGWKNGTNIRWVTIVKEDDLWKIQGLATSP